MDHVCRKLLTLLGYNVNHFRAGNGYPTLLWYDEKSIADHEMTRCIVSNTLRIINYPEHRLPLWAIVWYKDNVMDTIYMDTIYDPESIKTHKDAAVYVRVHSPRSPTHQKLLDHPNLFVKFDDNDGMLYNEADEYHCYLAVHDDISREKAMKCFKVFHLKVVWTGPSTLTYIAHLLPHVRHLTITIKAPISFKFFDKLERIVRLSINTSRGAAYVQLNPSGYLFDIPLLEELEIGWCLGLADAQIPVRVGYENAIGSTREDCLTI